jgi:hypothetical protein
MSGPGQTRRGELAAAMSPNTIVELIHQGHALGSGTATASLKPVDGRQCDQHHVPVAEVSGGLSLRSRHRAAVIAGGLRADNPRLGQRDQHTLAGRKLGRGLDHSARKARSWCRRQQRMIRTSRKPIGCGRSSSRASRKQSPLFNKFHRRSARRQCSSAAVTTNIAMYPNNGTWASGSGCMSKRISILLEEEIKLHRFAGISPEQFFTEASRHREAMVAAD